MGDPEVTGATQRNPALEESAEDLYESAPCGYLSMHPDFTIARVNQTFLTWTGYTRAEIVEKLHFFELLTVGGRIYHETHVAPLLRMQGFLNEIQLELRCKDGRQIPILVNLVSKKDGDVPILHRATIFDVSDRKRYERELLLARKKAEQAAQAKADFLSMMSHEIRTPMGAIVGIASLLQETDLTPQQKKYARILQSSSDNLLALLNDILDFSKMEAGKATLDARPFDMRRLVYGALYALTAKAEEKKIDVRVEIDDRLPPWLLGDPIKIGQVITNLVSNAIKFTHEGRVDVVLAVTAHEDDNVSFETKVIDTGIGIAPDRIDRIFEHFTQASADIGVKYGGTGLGLAISNKVLEMHSSRLRVTSEPDKGSCFSFALRLKVSAEAPPDDKRELEHRGELAGCRALVVDDNAVNVMMISEFLRGWGVEVEVARDGIEALHLVQAHDFDIVLMDLRMPRMNGYEATMAIRRLADPRRSKLPIIAVTASARFDIKDRLASSGFDEFLGKPFNPEALFAKIDQLVSARRRA